MEITYRQEGDYLIPNLALPENENKPIGKYGRLRLRYIQQYKKGFFTKLKLTCTLNSHLSEIDTTARERIDVFMKQAEKSAPDKVTKQMEWVGYMNNAKASIEEIIYNELIYT